MLRDGILPTADCRLPTADCRLPNCPLPLAVHLDRAGLLEYKRPLPFRGKVRTVHADAHATAPIAGPGRFGSANSNEENRTVKRTLSILAGVAILAVAGYFGGWGWAQYTQDAEITPPGVKTAGGPLRTRIAVLNMVKVLKKYKKFETYDNQYKAAQKSYAEPLEKLNGELIAKTAEA